MERDGAEDDVPFEEEANPLAWAAESFAVALGDVPAVPLTLDLGIASIRAEPGIASTTEHDPDQLMMGAHACTFWIPERQVEFALQLCEDVSGYYRLFGYLKQGIAYGHVGGSRQRWVDECGTPEGCSLLHCTRE